MRLQAATRASLPTSNSDINRAANDLEKIRLCYIVSNKTHHFDIIKKANRTNHKLKLIPASSGEQKIREKIENNLNNSLPNNYVTTTELVDTTYLPKKHSNLT